jgi:hypothetical protein
METSEVIPILERIAILLENGREWVHASIVRDALAGSAEEISRFLVSNDLWGGSGSIADSPLPGRSPERREVEALLIRLGRLQMDAGKTNIRTSMWVGAFEHWRQGGI